MARKSELRYIQYYTDGSAAKKLELVQPKKKTLPSEEPKQKSKKRVVRVDLLATCAIAVSVVMFVLMIVGMVYLDSVQQEAAAMASYVETLKTENASLKREYAQGYDLEEVERIALSMGMVPVEQAQHIAIRVQLPPQVTEPSRWERITTFLTSIFA